MSKRIPVPEITQKPCLVCSRIMNIEDYATRLQFRLAKTCSNKCGGLLMSTRVDTKWAALMAYPIKDAMEFEEIAKVAGVSRQRIHQIYCSAMRKLKNNIAVYKRLRELQ